MSSGAWKSIPCPGTKGPFSHNHGGASMSPHLAIPHSPAINPPQENRWVTAGNNSMPYSTSS